MIAALIVAAGRGLRMGTDRRKQFMALGGRPIVAHTLKAFDVCPAVEQIVVCLPEADMDLFRRSILSQADVSKEMVLVTGGPQRQDSVYNGLRAIEAKEGIVLIHDGVRPLVSRSLIEACLEGAKRWQACIPAVNVVDTLKQVNDQGIIVQSVPRDGLCMAQTPQAFGLSLIKTAHEKARRHGWQATDDALLVERMGINVHVIAGAEDNLKITTADDLSRAEAIYRYRASENPPVI